MYHGACVRLDRPSTPSQFSSTALRPRPILTLDPSEYSTSSDPFSDALGLACSSALLLLRGIVQAAYACPKLTVLHCSHARKRKSLAVEALELASGGLLGRGLSTRAT